MVFAMILFLGQAFECIQIQFIKLKQSFKNTRPFTARGHMVKKIQHIGEQRNVTRLH